MEILAQWQISHEDARKWLSRVVQLVRENREAENVASI